MKPALVSARARVSSWVVMAAAVKGPAQGPLLASVLTMVLHRSTSRLMRCSSRLRRPSCLRWRAAARVSFETLHTLERTFVASRSKPSAEHRPQTQWFKLAESRDGCAPPRSWGWARRRPWSESSSVAALWFRLHPLLPPSFWCCLACIHSRISPLTVALQLPQESVDVEQARHTDTDSPECSASEVSSGGNGSGDGGGKYWAKLRAAAQLSAAIKPQTSAESQGDAVQEVGADEPFDAEKIIKRVRSIVRGINPRGRFLRRWDVTLCIAIFCTAVLTPFEVAFLKSELPSGGGATLLFLINRLIDVIFIADVFINFFVPFRESPQRGSRLVYSPKKIAKNYLETNFALDVLSAFPFDLCVRASSASETSTFVRVLPLARMVRIIRLSRIASRWVNQMSIDLSLFELFKFLLMTIFTAHWLACLWGLAGTSIGNNRPINLSTWYVADYNHLSWVQKHQLTTASPTQLYAVCVYVALSNIFGGPCEINPANYIEFYVQGFMMLIGSSLGVHYRVGLLYRPDPISSFTGAPQDHGHAQLFCARSGNLQRGCSTTSHLLQPDARLRYYETRNQELMMTMTPQLRGDTSLVRGAKVFKKVWYLRSLWDSTLWTKAERITSTRRPHLPQRQPSSALWRRYQASICPLSPAAWSQRTATSVSTYLPKTSSCASPASWLAGDFADVLLDTTPDGPHARAGDVPATSDFEQLLIEHPGAAQVVRTATIKIRLQHLFRRTAAVAREQDKSGRKTDLYSAITEVRGSWALIRGVLR